MKKNFLNIQKQQNKKIGIYHFNNALSIGKITNILKNYLFLESYNTNNKKDELKVFLISKIKRIMLDSKYIRQLEKKDKLKKINFECIKNTDVRNFEEVIEKIIEKKFLVSLNFIDENQEEGYIILKDNDKYYFNIVNSSLEIISNEVFDSSYICEIKFLSSTVNIEQEKKVKIKLFSGKIYIGNIFIIEKDIVFFKEIKEFSEESDIILIKKENIEEITELINIEKFEIINFESYFHEFDNVNFFEVLEICQKFKIVVFIDNEHFSETKVGIITKLEPETLKLKILDTNYHFTEIVELKIREIEILRIKNIEIYSILVYLKEIRTEIISLIRVRLKTIKMINF